MVNTKYDRKYVMPTILEEQKNRYMKEPDKAKRTGTQTR